MIKWALTFTVIAVVSWGYALSNLIINLTIVAPTLARGGYWPACHNAIVFSYCAAVNAPVLPR